MIDEKTTEIIEDVTVWITGRKPVYCHDTPFFQTEDSIKISGERGSGNELIFIHEIGHYLAATPEERKDSNLGFGDSNELTPWALEKEIWAREISRVLFWPWAKGTLQDTERNYIEYLTHDIFKGPSYDKVGPQIEITNDDVQKKLEAVGLTIEKVHERLLKHGKRNDT